jgi:hypothetical protein
MQICFGRHKALLISNSLFSALQATCGLLLCWRTGEQSAYERLLANIGRNSFEHLLLTSSSDFQSAQFQAGQAMNTSTAASRGR